MAISLGVAIFFGVEIFFGRGFLLWDRRSSFGVATFSSSKWVSSGFCHLTAHRKHLRRGTPSAARFSSSTQAWDTAYSNSGTSVIAGGSHRRSGLPSAARVELPSAVLRERVDETNLLGGITTSTSRRRCPNVQGRPTTTNLLMMSGYQGPRGIISSTTPGTPTPEAAGEWTLNRGTPESSRAKQPRARLAPRGKRGQGGSCRELGRCGPCAVSAQRGQRGGFG